MHSTAGDEDRADGKERDESDGKQLGASHRSARHQVPRPTLQSALKTGLHARDGVSTRAQGWIW